jgi:hypothetical protein
LNSAPEIDKWEKFQGKHCKEESAGFVFQYCEELKEELLH